MGIHDLLKQIPTNSDINQLDDAVKSAEQTAQEQLKEERADFWRWYQELEEEKEAFEKKVEQEFESSSAGLKNQIQSLRDNIYRLETEKQRFEKLYEYEKNQNENFKRIATERAAQKEGVPKKEHPAYFLIYKEQWIEKIRDFDFDLDVIVHTWKQSFQTPYNSCQDYSSINQTILDDLNEKIFPFCDNAISFFMEVDNGNYQKLLDAKDDEATYVYKWSARANHKSGFWEITIYTTHELRGVPQHLTLSHSK